MKRLFLKLLVILSLAATSQSAFAARDTYFMHGSACIGTSGGQLRNQFGISYSDQGSGATFTCPFVTHASGSAFGATLIVHGYDRSDRADVSCTLTATDHSGTLVAKPVAGNLTGASDDPQRFKIRLNMDPTEDKYFFATCFIPTGTALGRSFVTGLALYVDYQ